jgi:hypothetical protein
MEDARITNRAAVEAFAAAADDAAGFAPDGLLEVDVDRLIEQVDRELAAAEYVETVRVSRDFTDQRRAHRAQRRGENAVLRLLTGRVDVADLESGEAA